MQVINIYADESCHLEHDGQRFMVLGAIWCPAHKTADAAKRLREFKARHRMPDRYELKWTSVSKGRQQYFMDVLDYFFDDDDLHFRALVADKEILRHEDFGQSHEDWYYKMFFDLLKVLLDPERRYHIYLDYKDQQGPRRIKKLHEVLSNNLYDFDRSIVQRIQLVRSHEVEQIQLADLLTGLLSYMNRGLEGNAIKLGLIQRMRDRSGLQLTKTTLPMAEKVNLFYWDPRRRKS
ncbi:MAG TPA: DUF3800 domain-containing protein [Flavobacteriales bacterium]|nr:DUF3800 domain-containing protein [Flavobacteriales bacterium]